MGKKTAEQMTEGLDLSHHTIIVTGGTNGLGKETVRVLAKGGAHVFLAARNLTAAEKVKEDIVKETPSAKVDLLKIDLSSLESVRIAAKEFLALNLPLNVLVCNAGIASEKLEFSVDGIELDFATNYLGHFLLTHLLLDKLKVTATESGMESRIVIVSSEAHEYFVYEGGIKFDAICKSDKTEGEGAVNFISNSSRLMEAPTGESKQSLTSDSSRRTKWSVISTIGAYGQSKLAQILHTKELAKRLQDDGVNNVTVNSLHPGMVRTNIANSGSGIVRSTANFILWIFGGSVEQGASLQTYLAVSPQVNGVTGKFFSKGKEYQLKMKYVLDEDLQKKLWVFSTKLISA